MEEEEEEEVSARGRFCVQPRDLAPKDTLETSLRVGRAVVLGAKLTASPRLGAFESSCS